MNQVGGDRLPRLNGRSLAMTRRSEITTTEWSSSRNDEDGRVKGE